MANANVIKSIKTKSNSGFSSPVSIGAESYFVSATRGSSLNNLEEQILLGTDCITTSWTEDDGTIRLTKEFYNADEVSPADYYRVEVYEYTTGSSTDEYVGLMPSGGTGSDIPTLKIDVEDIEAVDEDDIRFILTDSVVFELDNVAGKLIINPDNMVTNKSELYYHRSPADSFKVAEKLTYKTYNQGKEIVKEIISNQLS